MVSRLPLAARSLILADDTVEVVARQRGLTVLWLTVFVDQLGFGIVLPFLPLYADKLGASGFEVGLLLAIYSLMQMLVATSWGRLSDRVGRRPILVASALGASAGFVLLGCADSLALLFAGRAILGGFGVGMPTAQAWIADTTPPEDRGRALAVLGAAGGLGFVLGPAIGALGIAAGGMRLPFFLSAASAAANAVLALVVLPRMQPVAHAARTRAAGGWRLILPCLVVAFVLVYAFSGVEATFALFTRAELGLDAQDNGWLFMSIGVVAALTQAFGTGWLAGKIDEPRRVAFGLVLLGVGIAWMPTASSVATFVPPLVVLAIGQAIVAPSLTAWVSRRAPADRQGELIGLTQSVGALARVAGPGIGGLVFDHVGHGAPFHISGLLILGAAAAAWVARRA